MPNLREGNTGCHEGNRKFLFSILSSFKISCCSKRDKNGIFFTDNWLEFFRESPIAFEKLVKEHGKEGAKKKFRQIYKGFEHFYVVDTGAYNVEEVKAHLKPLVDILGGELTVVKGRYEILRKMIAGKIDQNFRVIKK